MTLYRIDPIQDTRWSLLVERHPNASVFHTVGWLKALRKTYGYEPVAFTTSAPLGELKNALVFCGVQSWLTRSRLVSLPFSDHCEPLCDSDEELNSLVHTLKSTLKKHQWKYLEVRTVNQNFGRIGDDIGFLPTAKYSLHRLELGPDLDQVFHSLDKDCVQRRVRRAQRAGLVEKCGRSEQLLMDFYSLFVITRSRHHLPPAPYVWFKNLVQCQGETLEIRLAYKGATPIAAILTLRFRNVLYYKYGCSDAQFHNLGAIPWLLWRAIAAAQSTGATEFDLGRTQEGNAGLLAFKNNWVAKPRQLFYWTFPGSFAESIRLERKLNFARQVFSYMPNRLLVIAGRLIYPHLG